MATTNTLLPRDHRATAFTVMAMVAVAAILAFLLVSIIRTPMAY